MKTGVLFLLGAFILGAACAEVEIEVVEDAGVPESSVEKEDRGRFEHLEPADGAEYTFPYLDPNAPGIPPIPDRPKRYAGLETKVEEYDALLEKKRGEIAQRLAELEAEKKEMQRESDRKFREEFPRDAEDDEEDEKARKKKEHKGKVVHIRPTSFAEGMGYVKDAMMSMDKFKNGTDEMWNKTQNWLSDITFFNPRDNTTYVLDLSFTDATWATTKGWLEWTWNTISGETFQDIYKRLRKTWEINSEEERLKRLQRRLSNAYKEKRAEQMEQEKEKYVRAETRHYMGKHEKTEKRLHDEELKKAHDMMDRGEDPIGHERGASARRKYRKKVKDDLDRELDEHAREQRKARKTKRVSKKTEV